jgi:sulfofructose kinase
MLPSPPHKPVIGIGLACLDQLLLWEDMKEPVLGNRIVETSLQGGGMTATALAAVARLGGRAELWAAIGDDWVGDRILQDLGRDGVDTSQVRRLAGRRSPFMIVCVDQPTGERHFLHWTGPLDSDGPLGSLDRLRGAGCLLVDDTRPETQLPAAREARRLGVPVVIDMNRLCGHTREVLPFVDCAIVGEPFVESLGAGGDHVAACRTIQDLGPARVVVTLGRRGLVYLDGPHLGHLPAFDVETVDTTGAGDVFHGAFCLGLVWGLAMEKNLHFASAVAALKCRRLGGRAGIPTRDEALGFLGERGVNLFGA